MAHYMPAEMIAELDEIRADLMRAGVRVDRSALIRAAVVAARTSQAEWIRRVQEEAS